MADIYQIPEGNSHGFGNDAATLLAASALAGNGGGWGGFGNNPLSMAFMFPFIMPFIMPFMNMMYGNGWGGGFGGGLNGGAGFLANQLNNDNGRELIMQAIQGNQTAISQIATLLNTTHDQILEGISSLNTSVLTVGNNVNLTGLQIINAMQSGNAALQSQICQSFADLANTVNTGNLALQNTVQNGTTAIQNQLIQNAGRDELAICQQTYSLTDGANRNTQAILAKLDAMETRALQDKLDAAREKNSQLTGEISQLNQNQYIAGVVGQTVAPINAALAGLNKEVDDIKCKLPNTVNVQYPNLVAVNATPYVSGGIYPNGIYGNYGGFGNTIGF